jgi:hypothetical protein
MTIFRFLARRPSLMSLIWTRPAGWQGDLAPRPGGTHQQLEIWRIHTT